MPFASWSVRDAAHDNLRIIAGLSAQALAIAVIAGKSVMNDLRPDQGDTLR